MKKVFAYIWQRVERFPWWGRFAVKGCFFCVVLLLVLFPDVKLLGIQVSRYLDMEALIQPDFPGIDAINHEIDTLLSHDGSVEQEFGVVQRYVYQRISYEYDWENWRNLDFWPTAEQVWERKREDCDGRAILAASILRSRGFQSVSLVASIRHVWVKVEEQGLMGPDTERNIQHRDGKTIVTLPSWRIVLESFTLFIADFPAIRHLLIFFCLLLVCYHPCRDLTGFLGMSSLGVVGLLLLKDWAQHMMEIQGVQVDITCLLGGGALLGSLFFAVISSRVFKEKT